MNIEKNTNCILGGLLLRTRELLSCFELSDKQLKNIAAYTEAVIETGRVMNLTTLTGVDDILIKHFYDCIFPFYKGKHSLDGKTLIDIGTGAGFPGMPLKFFCGGVKLFLLETTLKKLNFVKSVNERLLLSDIKYINLRAEDAAGKSDYREKYDYVTSRAVAQLNILLELCVPFVKPGGCFFAYKSLKSPEEIKASDNAMEKLGCMLEDIIEYELPDAMGSRSLLVFRKTEETDAKYPRAYAKIKKSPL